MQNKNNSKSRPLHRPSPSLAFPSPRLSACSVLHVRESTTGRTEDTGDTVATSRNLQSHGKRDSWIVITGKTWLAHVSGEGNKCSRWQFKRHSLDPWLPHLLCYCEVLLFFNLSAAWKKSTEAKRKQATFTLDKPIVRSQQLPGDKPHSWGHPPGLNSAYAICAHNYFDCFTGHRRLYQANSH